MNLRGIEGYSEEQRVSSLTSDALKIVNYGNHFIDLSLTTADTETGLVIARHQKDGLKPPAANSAERRLLEMFQTSPFPSVRRLYFSPRITETGLVWDRISELHLADHTGKGFIPTGVEKIDFSRSEVIGIDLFQEEPKLGWRNQSLHPWVQQFHYTSEALHRAITLGYNSEGQLNFLFVNTTSAEGDLGENGYVIGDPESDGIQDARYFAKLKELKDDGADGVRYRFWKPQENKLSIDILTEREVHKVTLPMISNPGRVLVDVCHPLLLIRPADPSPQLDEEWKGTDFLMAANISWVSAPK